MTAKISNPLEELPKNRKVYADTNGEPFSSAEAAMRLGDRIYPLPAPAPKCGQIWCKPDVGKDEDTVIEQMVLAVRKRQGGSLVAYWPREAPTSPSDWPPSGLILVSGPGAPWAPQED